MRLNGFRFAVTLIFGLTSDHAGAAINPRDKVESNAPVGMIALTGCVVSYEIAARRRIVRTVTCYYSNVIGKF
jgi:hypothetical protein